MKEALMTLAEIKKEPKRSNRLP